MNQNKMLEARRSYRMGSMGAPMTNGVQAPYGPADFAVDAAWKFVGQPIYNIASGNLMRSVAAPRDEVPMDDSQNAMLRAQELNRSNAAGALGAGMEAGGLAALGSFGAKAPAGALRSGPARPDAGLDMSQAARMQRAKEMGFDTDTVYYHGTKADFNEFRPSDKGAWGQGVYAAKEPNIAYEYGYGDQGSIKPLFFRGKMANTQVMNEALDNAMPTLKGNFAFQDGKELKEAMISDLQQKGFGGIMINDHAVIFDPSNIRSVNAAFDPAKSGSANLLAANNKQAAAAPAVLDVMRARNARILEQGRIEYNNPNLTLNQYYELNPLARPTQKTPAADVASRAADLRAERAAEVNNPLYKMQHQAPTRENYPDITNLDAVMPDLYGGRGLDYYGTGLPYDAKALNILRSAKEAPDQMITVYRAAPDKADGINPGDWVTTTREYALDHIGSDKGYKIFSKKVRASEIINDGNSIHEFGYSPNTKARR